MKRFFAGVAAIAMVGCSTHQEAQRRDAERREECITTRDVQIIVIRLREEGWSADRTVKAVLDVAAIADNDTQAWFAGLVSRVYGNAMTLADVQAEFSQCAKTEPRPDSNMVLAVVF